MGEENKSKAELPNLPPIEKILTDVEISLMVDNLISLHPDDYLTQTADGRYYIGYKQDAELNKKRAQKEYATELFCRLSQINIELAGGGCLTAQPLTYTEIIEKEQKRAEIYKELSLLFDTIHPEQREEAPEQREEQRAGNDKAEQDKAPQIAQNKQMGRKPKTFASRLLVDEAQKAATLKAFHTHIDGKKGKDVVLFIKAGIKAGIITKPTYTAVYNEFGDVGSESGFNAMMRKEAFAEVEISGAITALNNIIQPT